MTLSTQPLCFQCWEHYSITPPVQVKEKDRQQEVCCLCSGLTDDGIYMNLDPSRVPYPKGARN